jgi:hypothetical protein
MKLFKRKRSKTFSYAQRELEILSAQAKDPNNRPIIEPFTKEILALCDVFGKSGQSGGTAPMTAQAISGAVKTLLLQEPIADVTGEAWEWTDVSEASGGEEMYQNKRCAALFKIGVNGIPYYLDAIAFQRYDDNNDAFTSNDMDGYSSRQNVKSFPFRPKTFYVDVKRELYDPIKHGKDADYTECGKDGKYMYFIYNVAQLDRVFQYYDRYEITT